MCFGALLSFSPSLCERISGVIAIVFLLMVDLRAITSLLTMVVSALAQNSLRVSTWIGGHMVNVVWQFELMTASMISSYWEQLESFSRYAVWLWLDLSSSAIESMNGYGLISEVLREGKFNFG